MFALGKTRDIRETRGQLKVTVRGAGRPSYFELIEYLSYSLQNDHGSSLPKMGINLTAFQPIMQASRLFEIYAKREEMQRIKWN